MTNAIELRSSNIISTYDEVERVAKAMAASGFFPDAKSISQAIVKIMAGSEMGFGAFASMQGVNIIQGRPSYNANMMASAVKSSGKYNYRVIQLDDKGCEIAFYENGKESGRSTFTSEDAKKAGTKNLDKFPRNMYFARAMSNGVRWYCPDVMNGNAVYTPEELGADVDEDGNIVDAPAFTVSDPITYDDIVGDAIEDAGPEALMTLEDAAMITNSDGEFYGQLNSEKLAAMTIGINRGLKKSDLTDEQRETYLMKLQAIKIILQSRNED